MEKFRINNDLSIFWSITNKDGSPYSLSDKTVRLFVTHPRGRMDVTSDITVQDNVICWLFRGSRQRYLGTYKITIEIQASPADRTIRKDIPEAFELVSSTRYEQTEIGRPEIDESGELTLATSLDIFQIMPIIPQVGPNRNWWVDGVDTGKSSVGLTAYEFAKENGYEGTEEEYAAECLAVPVLNEESRTATAEASQATRQSIAQQESVNNYMNDVAEPTIARATKAASDAEQVAADIRSEADAALEGLDSAINSVNEAAETAKNAAAEATAAAEQAEKDVDAAIEAFGPAIANKADLDNGKIIASQLPDYILGQVMYGGLIYDDHTINASSNFISKYGNQTYLSASDASKYSGVYFIASGSFTDRTIVGVPQVSTGDWIISTGASWKKVDNSDAVTSVAGLVGNVNASALAAVLADLKDANSLARKSEFKTINGQSLVGTGNIKIEGKNYDNELAEQSAKLTQLSEELASNGVLIEDLQNTKIDRENDDYYPKMAVGLADNLAGVDVVDSEINFRRSGGGAITDGVARIESIKGNSVVWNQLANGAATLSLLSSHKYMTIIGSVAAIKTNIATLDFAEGDRVHDLTQMFGAGHEPTTIAEFYQRTPMGVDLNAYNEGEVIHMDVQSIESVGRNQWDEEWELGQIDNGTGEPVPSSGHIRSKNYIPVIAGATYYCLGSFIIIYYDDNLKQVDWWSIGGARTLTLPNNVHYVKLYKTDTTYKGDICINLSDPSINGQYYPYIKRVEDLAVIRKYFPEGMRSAGTAHDEIRYNKASGKWEKVVRIGEVDLGTVRWDKDGSGFFYHKLVGMKTPSSPLLCRDYFFYSDRIALRDYDSIPDKVICTSDGITPNILLKDTSYETSQQLKEALSGVILYYELAEPIVTELDEADQYKDLDYAVWNAGTEKAIAEGKSSALAADITYGFNAIGKIKELESLVAALRAKVGI